MARLEKINLLDQSWWSPVTLTYTPPNYDALQLPSQYCSHCGLLSDVIFNHGFTCLRTQCKKYFHFENLDLGNLDYNQAFLSKRTRYAGPQLEPLSPPLLHENDLEQRGMSGFEAQCKKGIVCPRCHCCSRRIEFRQWTCENKDCDFVQTAIQQPISVSEAIQQCFQAESLKTRKPAPAEFCANHIRSYTSHIGHYDITEYTIPGEGGEDIGFVRVLRSNGIINQQNDGPDDLFLQMQQNDIDLKRQPARLAGRKLLKSTDISIFC